MKYTANLYSHGRSEEILGRALKDYANRDDVVIATKIRHPMRSGPNGKGLSRKAIMAEIDHSLRRLGTDYVDLYLIHRMDNSTPLEETLEALHDVVKAGKVRYLGASSMHAWEDAVASLDITLTEDELMALESPYTPSYDFQGISDEALLNSIMARIPGFQLP